MKLLSDTAMSFLAELLWKSILEKRKLNVKIYDLMTKKTFDYNAIGKVKTEDGEKVSNPFNDNRPQEQQRFVFLAEGIESILDNGEGIDRYNMCEAFDFLQHYVYFGPPDL